MARRRALAIAAPSRTRSGTASRLLVGVLILGLVSSIVLAGAAGFFTFRIVTEHNDTENVTPASFLLTNYENLNFTDSGGGEHEGWLLRGLRGAPVIILCPGYDSNRSELLSLGAVLQENHFNVYLFNFRSSKTRQSLSNLGPHQAEDLQSAIQMISKYPGINSHRVGVFGVTTGAYATLVAATQDPLVKAIVVDSVFENPQQMFNEQLDQLLGGPSSLFRTLADAEFHMLNWGTKLPPVRQSLSNLHGVPKFFISGRDTPSLKAITEDLYSVALQPKTMSAMEHSQTTQASGADRKEYENEVLGFFLQNLPLRAD